DDGSVLGDNTDEPSLRAILESMPHGRFDRAVILGSGGVARAAAHALSLRDAGEVHIVARRGAEELATLCGGIPHPLERVPVASLVISTLPNDPALAQKALDEWIDAPFVLDLAYGG